MKKRIISSVLSALMIFTLVPVASASGFSQEDTAVIVGENQTSIQNEEIDFGNSATTISKDDVAAGSLDGYERIIIDASSMDESMREFLQDAFNNSSKIFVLGDFSSNELRDYLGLEMKASNEPAMLPDSIADSEAEVVTESGEISRVVDVSQFPDIGKMVYQDWRGTNITNVKSSNYGDTAAIEDLIQHCLDYDYLELSTNMGVNLAPLRADSWSRIDIETDSFDCDDRCIVDTSIRLEEYDGNPDSRGNYYYYVPFIVDITNKAVIRSADVTVSGSSISTIDDYGPTPESCNPGISVSFTLPKGIGVSFTPGPKLEISREAGGINNRSLTLRYQPLTHIGLKGYTDDNLRCDAHIESYQSVGSMAGGFGDFSILTYEYGTSTAGDYADPVTYENTHSCTVG